MVILVTGKNKITAAVREKFEKDGHSVSVAENAEQAKALLSSGGTLDLLVIGAAANDSAARTGDGGISSEPDWEAAEKLYRANVVESLAVVQSAFPCLEQGALKRICYLNLCDGSINRTLERCNYGLYMSACALNMQAVLLFNRMRRLGYTFRIFGMEKGADAAETAKAACRYFMENRSVDPENAKHTDENRLVMRDKNGREIPF